MSDRIKELEEEIEKASVSDWLNLKRQIPEDYVDIFPNAKIAAEIKNSPLFKALS